MPPPQIRGRRIKTTTKPTNKKIGSHGKRVGKRRTTTRSTLKQTTDKANKNTVPLNLDVNKDAGEYFRTNATFDQHYDAQNENRDLYTASIIAFDTYSIEIIANAKARALAAAIARHDKDLVGYLLERNKNFGFVDVLKAVTILDSAREKNSIEKKIERIHTKTNSVIKPQKLSRMRNDINNLTKMNLKAGSFSGATARLIKRWVRNFSEKELEFYALTLPTEPWRKLANVAHLNPSKDFPNAPWFLPFCFGTPVTQNTKVEQCLKMNAENVNELVAKFDLPYSLVRKFSAYLTETSKKVIAQKEEKLDSILWYYEELGCEPVDDVIRARLENNEKIELGYGKLMERLLMFKGLTKKSQVMSESINSLFIPLTEKGLKNFKSTVPEPVAILGDASSSMDVAIRTATIISSLLTAICSAKLTFFNNQNFEAKMNPKSVAEVLDLAFTTEASGCTAPAASLVPYYDRKEVIKTFIIVTDEEENTEGITTDGETWRFYKLFMEYRKNVYPATLIFVSFLHSQHTTGQMYADFVRDKVPDVLQFKFNRSRPDLTKLDSILGQICSKSSETFGGYVENVQSEIKAKGLANLSFNRESANTVAVSDSGEEQWTSI